MKTVLGALACVVSRVVVASLMLALAAPGHARPVVIEETVTLAPPDASWQYFGRFGVATDFEFALVSGERYVEDPATGTRHEGTAFLYRRSDSGEWTYQGTLGPIVVIPEGTHPGLAMNDGIAMTVTDRWRIWERPEVNEELSETFVVAPVAGIAPDAFQGLDIEIDSGRIMVMSRDCANTNVLRRFVDTFMIDHQLPIDPGACDRASVSQDIQDARAAVFNIAGPDGSLPANVVTFRLAEGGTIYRQQVTLVNGMRSTLLGPPLALVNPFLAVSGNRERYGTLLAFEYQPYLNTSLDTTLMPADGYLQATPESATALERAGPLMLAQRNHSVDRQAHVINVFERVGDEQRFEHVVTLQNRRGTSLGKLFDYSQRRFIVNGDEGDNVVRVYDLPPNFSTPAVQVHNFELESEGALWQRTAGSTFSIVNVGRSNVFRQASTGGNPAAFLPSGPTDNQAIQVEVTPRATTGANAWVGLITRRQDDGNYYYVTLRASGAVELKRMAAGSFTTLAAAPANTLTMNHRYRLRLESIGQTHRVYLDDKLVLTARDATHAQGTAGVMTNRTAADYDNVIVTPSPLTSIYQDNFSTPNTAWQFVPGPRWFANRGVFRPENIQYHARTVTGAPTVDQVVQVRIRPISFNEPSDWVGVLLRWRDGRNHAYVSLHDRDVIALWRRTNGTIQQLATARLTVTPGTWYTVRVENVGGRTRVYVNSWLVLESDADLGPAGPNAAGQSGVNTYRAMAEFDNFMSYQP